MILWIPGRLPGLNELLSGQSSASRGWSAYNSQKQAWAASIAALADSSGITPLGAGYFTYLFVEQNQKRDPSNIVAGGVKILEDAFVKAGILENDGWSQILGFVGYWTKSDRAGCLVHWDLYNMPSKQGMLQLLKKAMENGKAYAGRRDVGNRPCNPPARGARPRGKGSRGKLPFRKKLGS